MMLGRLIFLCFLAAVLGAKRDKKFIKQVVNSHKKYRTLHQVGPVVESKKMSKLAQKWAERIENVGIASAKKPKGAGKYGENVNFQSGKVKGNVHIDDLYIQQNYYKVFNLYGKEPPKENLDIYGPFTQMVWKATKKIGVGRAGGIAVIFYWPKGNIETKFADNVLAPKT